LFSVSFRDRQRVSLSGSDFGAQAKDLLDEDAGDREGIEDDRVELAGEFGLTVT
jgi:hypothetical protein